MLPKLYLEVGSTIRRGPIGSDQRNGTALMLHAFAQARMVTQTRVDAPSLLYMRFCGQWVSMLILVNVQLNRSSLCRSKILHPCLPELDQQPGMQTWSIGRCSIARLLREEHGGFTGIGLCTEME
jgi:hypothetical protein